jgi:urease accessory protein
MRARTVIAAGAWEPTREVDCVRLDYDARHRRRILLATGRGAELLLDLARPTRLGDGDGLVLEDGGVVRVEAAAEALAEIHVHDAAKLARIAWHLGNRHLPVQFLGTRLRIRRDHVIEEMVALLGGHVEPVEAPFDPESGAYAGGHSHHALDHDHAHDD